MGEVEGMLKRYFFFLLRPSPRSDSKWTRHVTLLKMLADLH